MKGKTVGFSGTQEGLSVRQILTIDQLLCNNPTVRIARSGDCIGADADFHKLAKMNGLWSIGHPPIKTSKRAFCDFDEELFPEEYLDRNKSIVDASDWMIFGPKEYKEKLRSGTWSTKRYAELKNVPYCIIWPNGKVKEESWCG